VASRLARESGEPLELPTSRQTFNRIVDEVLASTGLFRLPAKSRRSAQSEGLVMPPMPSSEISDVQSDILREQVVPEFLALLEDAPTLEHPAELEHLAATLLIPPAQPELPPEVGSAVVEALQARRDPSAAGVLAAFALLAPEPIAGQAHASAQRLAGEEVVSPAAARVGRLAVQEAVRIESANVELLVVLLAWPGGSGTSRRRSSRSSITRPAVRSWTAGWRRRRPSARRASRWTASRSVGGPANSART
jgi:hypothetical protein